MEAAEGVVRAVPGPPVPRRDALRSRRAILEAAERLFAQRGVAVPMYEVGRAAGVGQATLYRHFPDRAALVAAVLEERIETLETLAARHADDPACALVLLRAIACQQASSAAILQVIEEDSTTAHELGERVRRLIEGPLERAVTAGRVRPDFGVADFLMVLSMVSGVLERGTADDRKERCDRTLDLVLNGLAPRG